MRKTKKRIIARKMGVIIITTALSISTLGISYSYFGDYLISDADVSVAKMNIESVETGKIEYDYSQKKLNVIFELRNTGDVPVKLYVKEAQATMNRFFMEGIEVANESDTDEEKTFSSVNIEAFDGEELEVGDEAKEFTLEFTDIYVEDFENVYFETKIEIDFVYSEAESWKGSLVIEASDENRQLQAERYLAYMESKEAEVVQPEEPAVIEPGGGTSQATEPAAEPPQATEPAAEPPQVTEPAAEPPQATEPAAEPPQATEPAAEPPQAIEPAAEPPQATEPSAEPPAEPPQATEPSAEPPQATEPVAETSQVAEPEAATSEATDSGGSDSSAVAE